MRVKLNSVPSETPSKQPTLPAPSKKRFGKKLYAAIAIAVVAVIVVALLIPQGAAIIPLSVEYTVGERMVYDVTETVAIQMSNSTTGSALGLSSNSTVTMDSKTTVDVVDFDGELYTLNHSSTMELLGKPVSISYLEKVNKTGYTTWLFPGATETLAPSTGTQDPVLTGILGKPEVKVGDTWEIPLNANNATLGITGSLVLTFKGIQDITVPAGTYKVFRVDMTSKNVGVSTSTALPSGKSDVLTTTSTTSITMNLNGEYYVEFETGRQIQNNIQMTTHSQVLGVDTTTTLSSTMTLAQHALP